LILGAERERSYQCLLSIIQGGNFTWRFEGYQGYARTRVDVREWTVKEVERKTGPATHGIERNRQAKKRSWWWLNCTGQSPSSSERWYPQNLLVGSCNKPSERPLLAQVVWKLSKGLVASVDIKCSAVRDWMALKSTTLLQWQHGPSEILASLKAITGGHFWVFTQPGW